jgi:hypothetical protein
MRPSVTVFVALVVSSSWACGGVTTVRGEVVHPAAVPMRSFPRAWVVAGVTPQERSLAAALAQHVANGSDVEIVELAELEPARLSGSIPLATVIVLPRLAFAQSSVTRWTSRPETVCGSAGCFRTRRSYQYEVPVLRAEVTLTVYDGPTATVLQEVKVATTEEGREYDVMENRAVAALAQKIAGMVDQRVEDVEVALLDVEVEVVRSAIAQIDAGDWAAGRRALEAMADDDAAMSSLSAEAQARVFYDLGMARLYDRTTLEAPETHFLAAKEALARAFALHPERRYREVQRQDEATDHNFRIGEGIPNPPPAYRRTAPPMP